LRKDELLVLRRRFGWGFKRSGWLRRKRWKDCASGVAWIIGRFEGVVTSRHQVLRWAVNERGQKSFVARSADVLPAGPAVYRACTCPRMGHLADAFGRRVRAGGPRRRDVFARDISAGGQRVRRGAIAARPDQIRVADFVS